MRTRFGLELDRPLVLVMGEQRPLWQIVLGSILAGLMGMTRINMLPVLPLLVLYIFWQHGLKASVSALLAGGATVIFSPSPGVACATILPS